MNLLCTLARTFFSTIAPCRAGQAPGFRQERKPTPSSQVPPTGKCPNKTRSCRYIFSVQFSSVPQSCLTLCDPMNRSTPGLSVHHQLLEFTQTHVHRVGDAIQPSHPLSSPSPPAPQSLPASEFFPMSQLFA